MTVHIPGALQSYTQSQRTVSIQAASLAEALAELDRRFPGIRFRIMTEQETIRRHIRLFVNDRQAFDIHTHLQRDDELYIVLALSGG